MALLVHLSIAFAFFAVKSHSWLMFPPLDLLSIDYFSGSGFFQFFAFFPFLIVPYGVTSINASLFLLPVSG